MGLLCPYRAGADGTERRCEPSAAKLERTAAVVVLTVAMVKKAAAKKTAPVAGQGVMETAGQEANCGPWAVTAPVSPP